MPKYIKVVNKMRINGLNNVGNVYNTKKSNKAYGANKTGKGKDSVSFSSFAKDLAIAKKEVDKADEVRMDRVETIKSQIESGQYNISASQIADKLLNQS